MLLFTIMVSALQRQDEGINISTNASPTINNIEEDIQVTIIKNFKMINRNFDINVLLETTEKAIMVHMVRMVNLLTNM